MKKAFMSRGFVLPTVLITSVVMMIVLLSALTATTSVSTAIKGQYVDRLTKEASESGLAMANACLKANGNTPKWTNSTPLMPNTDCTGDVQFACPDPTNNPRCYLVNDGTYRTSFSVTRTTGSDGKVTDLQAKGIVNQVRASNSAAMLNLENFTQNAKTILAAQGVISSSLTSLSDAGGLCGITSTGEVICVGPEFQYVGYKYPAYVPTAYVVKNWTTGAVTNYGGAHGAPATVQPFNGLQMTSIATTGYGSTYGGGGICGTTTAGEVVCFGQTALSSARCNLLVAVGTNGSNCSQTPVYSVKNWTTGAVTNYGGNASAPSTVKPFDGLQIVNVAMSDVGGICGVTTTGEVVCAGPEAAYGGCKYAVTLQCSVSAAYVVKNWTTGAITKVGGARGAPASVMPFNGLQMSSIAVSSYGSTYGGGGICGVTSAGEVVCFGQTAPSSSQCNLLVAVGTNASNCAQTPVYSVKNWTTGAVTNYGGNSSAGATVMPFNGTQITNVSYSDAGGICGVTSPGEVICVGPETEYTGTKYLVYMPGAYSVKNWTTGAITNVGGSHGAPVTVKPFNGLQMISVSASGFGGNYGGGGVCGITTAGEMVCFGQTALSGGYACNLLVSVGTNNSNCSSNAVYSVKNWTTGVVTDYGGNSSAPATVKPFNGVTLGPVGGGANTTNYLLYF